MPGGAPKGGLLQTTGCDRDMASEKASPVGKNSTCRVVTKEQSVFHGFKKKWQLSTMCMQAPAPHALQAHMASEVSFPRSVLESYTDRHYHNTSRSFPTYLIARAPEKPLVREFCPETLLKKSTRPGFVHAEEIWRARRKRHVKA